MMNFYEIKVKLADTREEESSIEDVGCSEEWLEKIYNIGLKKFDELLSRKQHLETKIIYMLQVTGVIIPLILAFEKPKDQSIIYYFSIIFLAITMITLVLAQNDGLLKNKFIRFLLSYNYNTKVEQTLYNSLPSPKMVYDLKKKSSASSLYNKLIDALQDSIETGENIIQAKTMLFKLSLFTFIVSIVSIIIMKVGS